MGIKERDDFKFAGLDELEAQLKLFQLGIESFTPYANQSKVDMIIRTDNGNLVRYADVKVCTGKSDSEKTVWKLPLSFCMTEDSFILFTFRLIEEETEQTVEKHYLVLKLQKFLEITEKHGIPIEDDHWVMSLPTSDINKFGVLDKKKKISFKAPLARSLRQYLDVWKEFENWKEWTE
ncbi:MAG: hypothetical protein ACFFFG_03575 [Candidatus Thorarchaeota archaeon]